MIIIFKKLAMEAKKYCLGSVPQNKPLVSGPARQDQGHRWLVGSLAGTLFPPYCQSGNRRDHGKATDWMTAGSEAGNCPASVLSLYTARPTRGYLTAQLVKRDRKR